MKRPTRTKMAAVALTTLVGAFAQTKAARAGGSDDSAPATAGDVKKMAGAMEHLAHSIDADRQERIAQQVSAPRMERVRESETPAPDSLDARLSRIEEKVDAAGQNGYGASQPYSPYQAGQAFGTGYAGGVSPYAWGNGNSYTNGLVNEFRVRRGGLNCLAENVERIDPYTGRAYMAREIIPGTCLATGWRPYFREGYFGLRGREGFGLRNNGVIARPFAAAGGFRGAPAARAPSFSGGFRGAAAAPQRYAPAPQYSAPRTNGGGGGFARGGGGRSFGGGGHYR